MNNCLDDGSLFLPGMNTTYKKHPIQTPISQFNKNIMKTTILTTALLFISLFTFAGGKGKFQKAMGETLAGYAQCENIEDFQALANKFQMIAKAEKKEWLPRYYHAHCLISMSFMEQEDKDKKDAYLDLAEESLNEVLDMEPKNAEAHALQALFYTARLVVDPNTRGQQYSMLSGMAVGKALSLDSKNPRARYIKLSNDMGAARFFGQDPSSYCPQASKLLSEWDAFKVKSAIHPSWGKNRVEEVIANCEK